VLTRARRYLQRFQSVLWCREAIMAVRSVGRRFRGVVSLRTAGTAKGNVLISYTNEGFLFQRDGEPVPIGHPSYYKGMVMAQTFLDLGMTSLPFTVKIRGLFPENRTMWPRKTFNYSSLFSPKPGQWPRRGMDTLCCLFAYLGAISNPGTG